MWDFSENGHLVWSVTQCGLEYSLYLRPAFMDGPLDGASDILAAKTRPAPGACLPHGSSLSLGLTPLCPTTPPHSMKQLERSSPPFLTVVGVNL